MPSRFAYITGWRKSEVLTLAWPDVDRTRGVITLRREHTKNAEPRRLPLTPTLAAIIEARWQARSVTRADGTTTLAARVFHRAGRARRTFRKAWHRPARRALAGLLFPDLRRSATRNFERAGVSQTVAMQLTGHKTASGTGATGS